MSHKEQELAKIPLGEKEAWRETFWARLVCTLPLHRKEMGAGGVQGVEQRASI